MPARDEARRHLNLATGVPVILCVSRLTEKDTGKPHKTEGVLDLVSVLVALPSDVILVIVGDGPGRQRVEARIAEAEVGDRVRLIGSVEHDDLKWFYAACDVFAYPDSTDLPRVAVLEAQACSRPVVLMRNGSAEATVDDGRTGLLANDLDEFRAHLAALAGDRARCESMGEAARAYVLRFHSIDRHVRQIEDWLRCPN